jgi:hypothetical protein
MIGTRAFIEETGKLEEWNGIEWVPSLVEDSKSNLPKIIEITNNLAKIIDRRAISRWWHTSNPKLSDQTPLEKLENGGVLVSRSVGRTRVFSFNPRYPMVVQDALLESIDANLTPAEDQSKYDFDATVSGINVDLTSAPDPKAQEAFMRLAEKADVVVEGYRPGVVKRLGVDYEAVSKRNPRIVYCSLSGFGQTGPYSNLVGHDINYISVGGALGAIGWPDTPPAIPLNVIADFAGGGLYAAFAILAAIVAREKTGRGQYVDMAMSDGVTSLLAMSVSQYFGGGLVPKPGADFLNGGLPCYNVFECSDGKWLSIGSLEPWFWKETCEQLGVEQFIPNQNNREMFPEMFETMRKRFKEKTRDEWFEQLRQHDICVGPVYSLDEALEDHT